MEYFLNLENYDVDAKFVEKEEKKTAKFNMIHTQPAQWNQLLNSVNSIFLLTADSSINIYNL